MDPLSSSLPISNEDQPIGRRFAFAEQTHVPRPSLPTGCMEEGGKKDPKVPFATLVRTEMWMSHRLNNLLYLSGGRRCKGLGKGCFLNREVTTKKSRVRGRFPPNRIWSSCLPAPAFQ